MTSPIMITWDTSASQSFSSIVTGAVVVSIINSVVMGFCVVVSSSVVVLSSSVVVSTSVVPPSVVTHPSPEGDPDPQ